MLELLGSNRELKNGIFTILHNHPRENLESYKSWIVSKEMQLFLM
jgi:hypothetical protein